MPDGGDDPSSHPGSHNDRDLTGIFKGLIQPDDCLFADGRSHHFPDSDHIKPLNCIGNEIDLRFIFCTSEILQVPGADGEFLGLGGSEESNKNKKDETVHFLI